MKRPTRTPRFNPPKNGRTRSKATLTARAKTPGGAKILGTRPQTFKAQIKPVPTPLKKPATRPQKPAPTPPGVPVPFPNSRPTKPGTIVKPGTIFKPGVRGPGRFPMPNPNPATGIKPGRLRPGTLGEGVILQPGVLDDLLTRKNSADPLLLLPMRLEYRFVKAAAKIDILDRADDVVAFERARHRLPATMRTTSQRIKHEQELKQTRARILATPPRVKKLLPLTTDSLWFRWFPDSNFAESGIAAPNAEELAARDAFLAVDVDSTWPGPFSEAANQAWQTFVANVGLSRAMHIMRTPSTDKGDAAWEKRVGRIAALPKQVHLFALTGTEITALAQAGQIPPNTAAQSSVISYAPDQLDELEWLTQFKSARDNGMGLKLTDPAKVKIALNADWILAVGLSAGKAADDIERLLRDHVANGALEFLPQDSPTNNSPTETTKLRARAGDVLAETTRLASPPVKPQHATAADLLSEALGLPTDVLQHAANADDPAFADAQAMMRVVGPALLDEAMDGKTHLADVTETEFLDAMAAAVVARGALAPLRIGDSAYGVATITDVTQMSRNRGSAAPKDRVEAFLMDHTTGLRLHSQAHAKRSVPVMTPEDADPAATLDEVLKINRVSKRLDVADGTATNVRSIGCPYIAGTKPHLMPSAYLRALRLTAIKSLTDPTEKDRSWPLLYRLGRQTLTRNTAFQVLKPTIAQRGDLKTSAIVKMTPLLDAKTAKSLAAVSALSASGLAQARPGALADLPSTTLRGVMKANHMFSQALLHLEAVATRNNGNALLSTLMMEVFDLFQHRLDAWATGLAYSRLKESRQENRTHSLHAGYYAMIGRLRTESVSGKNDGYVQAPTSAQATSAAVMRSAYLRHHDNGAFAINLRSARARQALKLLELLRKGLSISEALGLRGERWLRDHKEAAESLRLRDKFPLKSAAAAATPQRVFDGLALTKAAPSSLTAAQRALRAALVEMLDALTDLITAEAVHQRTIGATDAASAWLAVLSGGSVPAAPAVLKTQRYGHGSDHRVSLLLPPLPATPNIAAPRTLADGYFSAMAENILPDFDTAFVEVTATLATDPQHRAQRRYALGKDLGMTPVDFVVGGLSEARARAGHRAKRSWIAGESPFADLGTLPVTGTAAALNAEVVWDISSTDLETNLDLATRAERLRKIAQQGRVLDAADMNTAADATVALSEDVRMDLLRGALDDMSARGTFLANTTQTAAAALSAAREQFFERGFAAARADDTVPAAVMATQGADLMRHWNIVQDRLQDAAAFGLPQTLRLVSLGDMLADLRGSEETILAHEKTLRTKINTLRRAVQTAAQIKTQAQAAGPLRGALNALMKAVQDTLDGTAMPVAPRIARIPATRPALEAATAINTAFADWAKVRKSVRTARDMLAPIATWRAFPVAQIATVQPADPDDGPELPENEDPLARHFGLFLSAHPSPHTQAAYSGFVVDDWTEQRPSDTQDAAIAMNYDTPQSEAPNCLLVCVPPKAGGYQWTEERAATMVRETIIWMQVRALASHDNLGASTLRPGMNQVAYAGHGKAQIRRIPKALTRLKGPAAFQTLSDAQFVQASAGSEKIKGFQSQIREAISFSRIKE